MPEVSSMKMGASESCAVARCSRGQSLSWRRPVRRRWESMRPTEQSMRMASAWADISRLNTATGILRIRATFCAMFMASAVLPMEGRAASTIMSAGCSPAVMRSRSA